MDFAAAAARPGAADRMPAPVSEFRPFLLVLGGLSALPFCEILEEDGRCSKAAFIGPLLSIVAASAIDIVVYADEPGDPNALRGVSFTFAF